MDTWIHPETGERATVQQFPPHLEPDTWCTTFFAADGSHVGGANLTADEVTLVLAGRGFQPAGEVA